MFSTNDGRNPSIQVTRASGSGRTNSLQVPSSRTTGGTSRRSQGTAEPGRSVGATSWRSEAGVTEREERMPSVRPPRDDGGQALGGNEFERLCEKVVGRIARRDIGRMWDEAVDRDAAGQVTAEKHGQLIEFFYLTCVLVGMAGGGRPLVVTDSQLRRADQLLDEYRVLEPGEKTKLKVGPHQPNRVWYVRPGKQQSRMGAVVQTLGQLPGRIVSGTKNAMGDVVKAGKRDVRVVDQGGKYVKAGE